VLHANARNLDKVTFARRRSEEPPGLQGVFYVEMRSHSPVPARTIDPKRSPVHGIGASPRHTGRQAGL